MDINTYGHGAIAEAVVRLSADEAKAMAKFVNLAMPFVRNHAAECHASADELADCFHAEQARFKASRDFGNEREAREHQHNMANYVRDWGKASGEADDAEYAIEAAAKVRHALELFVATARRGGREEART